MPVTTPGSLKRLRYIRWLRGDLKRLHGINWHNVRGIGPGFSFAECSRERHGLHFYVVGILHYSYEVIEVDRFCLCFSFAQRVVNFTIPQKGIKCGFY